MKKFDILPLFLALLLTGCAKEYNEDVKVRVKDLPIEFVMDFRPMDIAGALPGTRVAKDSYEFEEGDVIHVSAVFTLMDGDKVYGYDCLQLSGGKWISKESDDPDTPSSPMLWPWDAEKATFKVYYLAHSTGILARNTEALLDDLRNQADPVFAEAVDVPYAAAVNLQFSHLCAKLIVTGLKEGEKEFWIQKENLLDAFSLSRSEADESLDFMFIEAPDYLRAGQEHRVIGTSDGTGNAVFYLAPGNYVNMKITYSYGLAYLELTGVDALADLRPNTEYTLNIRPGSGNVDEGDEDDWWPDPDDKENDVILDTDDIDGLLRAIHDGKQFITNDGVLILAAEDQGTVLLKNLDFNNNPFTWQVLPNGTVFDGKYHYIKNVSGSSIFSRINGEICNLGISGGRLLADGNANNVGLLSPEVSSSATLKNLRLKDITVGITPPRVDEVCNVGALAGNAAGPICDVKLGGNISVYIDSPEAPGRVHIGGLVGQSSANIADVSLMDDDDPVDIEVNCNCRFNDSEEYENVQGDRYVGGLVGLSTGSVDNCRITANVTSANTQGVLMYTGGLVGMLRGTEEGASRTSSLASLSNSVVSGNVTGGLAFPLDNTINGEGRSYTGGLVGYAYSVSSVRNCKSLGQVNGHDYQPGFSPYPNAYYAIGGAFGQIYASDTAVSGVDARSEIITSLSFPSDVLYFIGLFAGRSDIDYKGSNSNHNSGSYDFIGEIGNIHYR